MPTLKDSILGRPVLDKDGNLIGVIGPEEEKALEISPEEKITQGLIAAGKAKQKEIEEAMNSMADYVARYKREQAKINWASFSSRIQVEEKLAPLREAIEMHRKIVYDEIHRHLGMNEHKPFRDMVDAHMKSFGDAMGLSLAPLAQDPRERIEQGISESGSSSISARQVESTIKAAEDANGNPGSSSEAL